MKNYDVASNTNLVRNWSTNGHVAQVNRLWPSFVKFVISIINLLQSYQPLIILVNL